MDNTMKKTKWTRAILIAVPVLIVILLVINGFYISNFNHQIHESQGIAETENCYMYIDSRADSTSTWLKRDFDLNGETVDLNAQTFDGDMHNQSNYEIESWSMTLHIMGDCFINNAWCGTVEIHQHVGTDEEKIQTLDLRNYNLDDVTLDYQYDGDLLIPLSEGDFIIYYPSEVDGETPINADSGFTTGFIFYYLELPDLSNYTVEYNYGRDFTDCMLFGLAMVLLGLWLFGMILYAVSRVAYKTAVRDMEIKKSGISSMSDIYAIIYIIDLVKNELIPVSADEDSEKLRPKNFGAREQLKNLFEWDSTDAFKQILLEFCDLDTLKERMQNRNTLVCEYISKNYGWCQIRFFTMDRDEKGDVEKVVFTIQVIEEEKAEMEEISNRVDIAEEENKTKSSFLANVAQQVKVPMKDIQILDAEILAETQDGKVRGTAEEILSTAGLVQILLDSIQDYADFEKGEIRLEEAEYSLNGLLEEIQNLFRAKIESEYLEFQFDRTQNLPDRLMGDKFRLEQILAHLITNAIKFTEEGNIRFSVYGKNMGDKVHFLFSVKDTGIGMSREMRKELANSFSSEEDGKCYKFNSIGLNLVVEILKLMDSELHIISKENEGTELYFEIEQKIAEENA